MKDEVAGFKDEEDVPKPLNSDLVPGFALSIEPIQEYEKREKRRVEEGERMRSASDVSCGNT